VAVDADGTIIGLDECIPTPLLTKLRRINAAGVPVVLATGRAWASAKLVVDQLGFPQMYCVCNNGATVVTYPPLQRINNVTFDPAPLIAVVRHYPTTVVAIEDFGRGYFLSQPWPPQGPYKLHGDHTIVSLDEMASRPASRMILRDFEATPAAFDAMIARLDLTGLSHSRGGDNWYDIASGAAGKDNGLTVVTTALGLTSQDVLAFGDADNDLAMLAWAGRGVALGDAAPAVQAVADAVTPPFAEGGILSELERWFG